MLMGENRPRIDQCYDRFFLKNIFRKIFYFPKLIIFPQNLIKAGRFGKYRMHFGLAQFAYKIVTSKFSCDW